MEEKKDINKESKSDKMCAPGKRFEAGSCASLYVIIKLVEAYNEDQSDENKIKLSQTKEVIYPNKYKKYLILELQKRIGDKCTNQKCWSKQEFIKKMEKEAKDEFTKYTFLADSPQGKFAWLSTININSCMEQYEKVHKDFKFLGAVPMDFASLPNLMMNKLNMEEMINNGINKYGIVFNLDEHYKSGSHWVAMYVDFNKCEIYYFDSVGIKPEERVRAYMRKLTKYCKNDPKIDYNKVQHQRKNTECGVYSIDFIINMLEGKGFKELCENPVSDDDMNKKREKYFDKYVHEEKNKK